MSKITGLAIQAGGGGLSSTDVTASSS